MIRWPERRNDVLMAGGADGRRSTRRRGGSFRGVNWSEARHAAAALWRPGGRTAAQRTTLKSP